MSQVKVRKKIIKLLNQIKHRNILENAIEDNKLLQIFKAQVCVDSININIYGSTNNKNPYKYDLKKGIPDEVGNYNLKICREGLEHVSSLLLFLTNAAQYVNHIAKIIITTRYIWYMSDIAKYFIKGFYLGFTPVILGYKIRYDIHLTS